jgi:methionyl-tRNA formyltransferase
MKVCFFGSDQIAAAALNYLHTKKVEVLSVVTKKDKKIGRGLKQTISSVKKTAISLKLPVFHPDTWQELSFLPKEPCCFFVVVNFGRILPQKLLDFPKKSCLNIHFSLLPRWRGAAPVRDCLRHGDEFSGVSIMKMVAELDAGDVLAQKKIKITPQMNYQTLTNEMLLLGCSEIFRVLQNYDSIKPVAQNPELVTYSSKIQKQDGLVSWKNSAKEIYQLYQAFTPNPGIFSYWKGKKIFLRKISLLSNTQLYSQKGVIINHQEQGLEVSTARGTLLLEQVQLENKKQLSAKDWCNGYRISLKEQFDE